MKDELRELYQEMILDHYKSPRNQGKLPTANCHASGVNPLCGDKVTIHIDMEDDRVKDIRFEGSGCAISTASASMMTESLKGRPVAEVSKVFEKFHELVTKDTADENSNVLGKLKVFCGVREFPVRVKCASLAWHTLKAALENEDGLVSTE